LSRTFFRSNATRVSIARRAAGTGSGRRSFRGGRRRRRSAVASGCRRPRRRRRVGTTAASWLAGSGAEAIAVRTRAHRIDLDAPDPVGQGRTPHDGRGEGGGRGHLAPSPCVVGRGRVGVGVSGCCGSRRVHGCTLRWAGGEGRGMRGGRHRDCGERTDWTVCTSTGCAAVLSPVRYRWFGPGQHCGPGVMGRRAGAGDDRRRAPLGEPGLSGLGAWTKISSALNVTCWSLPPIPTTVVRPPRRVDSHAVRMVTAQPTHSRATSTPCLPVNPRIARAVVSEART
jgi:hypothetical protein